MSINVKNFYESCFNRSRMAAEKIKIHITERADLCAKTESGYFDTDEVTFKDDMEKKFMDLFDIINDLEFILKESESYLQERDKKFNQCSPSWSERNPNYSTPPSDGLH